MEMRTRVSIWRHVQPQAISTVVSEKMSSPTPAVQPDWKAEAKLVSKGEKLENKSVKDQRPGFKKDDLRDHHIFQHLTLTTKSPGDATTKLLGWKPSTQSPGEPVAK